MDKTGKLPDLFVKLSPGIAAALAARLIGFQPARLREGRAALQAAWASLNAEKQAAYAQDLARVHDLCTRHARKYVLDHARESRRDRCPSAGRVLEAVSTPDLAVRLYLDDPEALERAHFHYATALLEEIALYQGQYVADVIPSYDRRARMLKALQSTLTVTSSGKALTVAEFVSDDRFVLALHRGAHVSGGRRFDGAGSLDPNLCQPEIEAGLLFRFDSSMLIVKASTLAAREALRDAFIQIFVGDPHYFDARQDHRPRFRLTIDPVAAVRPTLAKAITRPKVVPFARELTQVLQPR